MHGFIQTRQRERSGGALDGRADGRGLKVNTTREQHNGIDLCMTRAGDVYYRLRERKERGILWRVS